MTTARCVRLARCVGCGVLLAVSALAPAGCEAPVSPSAVVVGVKVPEALVGHWHGVSARQTAGTESHWNLEDLDLWADGSVEIVEYEGPRGRDAGIWDVGSDDVVVMEFPRFSDRRGVADASTMILTCTSGSRAWELTFVKH